MSVSTASSTDRFSMVMLVCPSTIDISHVNRLFDEIECGEGNELPSGRLSAGIRSSLVEC